MSLFIFEIIAFSGSSGYILLHPSEDPIDIMMQKLAQILMVYVGLFMMGMGRWYRKKISEVISFVNTASLAVLERKDYLQHRPRRNKIYLAMVLILLITTLADTLSPIGFFRKTLESGELYFKNMFLFDVTPNSGAVYFVAVLQVCVFYYVYAFCTMFIVVVIEPFLLLAMCYQVIATDIRKLRQGPAIDESVEFQKLRSLMHECNEINR